MIRLDEIELITLKRLAEFNEFYKSLLKQYNKNGTLSTKQYNYVEEASKKAKEAAQNSRKLTEYNKEDTKGEKIEYNKNDYAKKRNIKCPHCGTTLQHIEGKRKIAVQI